MRPWATLAERFRAARTDGSQAVLEGFHAVKHALRFGAVLDELVTADPMLLAELAASLAPDLATVLAERAVPVTQGQLAELAPMPPGTGVIALARRPPATLADVADDGPIVLLDRPSHLGNVGAVIRVAAAAGAAAVLTTGGLDPWHPAAIRGSAGLHFAQPVLRVPELPELPELGRPLVALDPDGLPLRPGLLPPSAVLAFGTERGGLSTTLRDRADLRLAIPMRPGVSSLNLATAVAVTLYSRTPA